VVRRDNVFCPARRGAATRVVVFVLRGAAPRRVSLRFVPRVAAPRRVLLCLSCASRRRRPRADRRRPRARARAAHARHAGHVTPHHTTPHTTSRYAVSHFVHVVRICSACRSRHTTSLVVVEAARVRSKRRRLAEGGKKDGRSGAHAVGIQITSHYVTYHVVRYAVSHLVHVLRIRSACRRGRCPSHHRQMRRGQKDHRTRGGRNARCGRAPRACGRARA